ncbi:hypothetical protein OHT52_21270 [Streptomyces sp. NBC_00247]|uniref:hypothetical protein n=1 Tax=Streptomyces sp. NBC_00247 TaxID=2975689 RepID=UPI002E27C0BA|nr:hypothetical protein [Streptomyces sp. NBC_00247]
MSYFAVDDGAHNHPKILRAKNAAVGLWARIGSYVGQQLLDGHVPGEIAKSYGTAPQIKNLLDVGLWHAHGHACSNCPQPRPGDYYMHDYLAADSGNRSRAEVLAGREKAAAKKRQQRGQAPRRPPGPAPWQAEFDDEPPADDEAAPPEEEPRRPRPPRPVESRIAPDWEPSSDDVHAAQVARQDAGMLPLTLDQLDSLTHKFVRRMTDDGRTAVAWGGRWRQWAESERPPAPSPGGVVVHLPTGRGQGGSPSTADQRTAAAFALAAELRAEGNQ